MTRGMNVEPPTPSSVTAPSNEPVRVPINWRNLVLIGGSESSGTTALSQILDQHPAIASGAELWFFCKPPLYDAYPSCRRAGALIRTLGLTSRPYSERRNTFEHLQGFGLSSAVMYGWLREAADIGELAARVLDHVQRFTEKPLWVEKTPPNIRTIGPFLRRFPGARVIHIVRDPRDVMLSLAKKRRQKALLPQATEWLAAVAAAAPYRGHRDLYEIRYEDLCERPGSVLESVCVFLGLPYDTEYFGGSLARPSALGKHRGSRHWTLRPGDRLSTAAIGRHRGVGIDWGFLSELRLSPGYARVLGASDLDLPTLARAYGYDVDPAKEPAAAYRPLWLTKKRNRLWEWFDRAVGGSPYMPQVEFAGNAAVR